jgi:hypothetical protein
MSMRRSYLSRSAIAALLGCALACACSQRSGDPVPAARSETPVTEETQCGASKQRDCPLQAWMKANALAALNAGDQERLGYAFRRMTTFGPPEYPAWNDIAERGANAAAARDLEGVRAACKECHDHYRGAYRRDLRPRVIR